MLFSRRILYLWITRFKYLDFLFQDVLTCLFSKCTAATSRSTPISRSSLVVEAKQNAKQRERLSEAQRVYNKARKSAVATRIKKVTIHCHDQSKTVLTISLAALSSSVHQAGTFRGMGVRQ